MRFFTPDLLERFGSEDDSIATEAHKEFEARSREYLRQLDEIAENLPQRLRALLEHHYLHDARVISHSPFGICAPRELGNGNLADPTPGAQQTSPDGRLPSFWIHLQLDTPPREILVLQYRSALIEEARLHQSPGGEESPNLEWLYDEVDLIPVGDGREFRHSILFTNGLELRLRFEDFDFATLKPIEIAPELAEA